jgi:hypothetical protein
MRHLSGSCLCGKVTLQVADRFGFIGYCHCAECRKWSGSAFASGGMVDESDFSITSGEQFVSIFHKTEDTDLAFCSNCGSSLFSKKVKRGKYVVRLGILDDVPTQRPNVHIFWAEKAAWFDLTDGLEKHDKSA